MVVHTLTSVKEKEKQNKHNDLKQFLDKTINTVNFLQDVCNDDNKRIASLTAKNKSLRNENNFYKEEIERLDTMLDDRDLKIQSMISYNNEIKNDINGGTVFNIDFNKMKDDKERMINEMVNDDSILFDKEFEKIKAERKRKNEDRQKKYNII
jgi:hypothetical protein